MASHAAGSAVVLNGNPVLVRGTAGRPQHCLSGSQGGAGRVVNGRMPAAVRTQLGSSAGTAVGGETLAAGRRRGQRTHTRVANVVFPCAAIARGSRVGGVGSETFGGICGGRSGRRAAPTPGGRGSNLGEEDGYNSDTTHDRRRRHYGRGALVVMGGSLRPKGITDDEWEQILREKNPNYRRFSDRAKQRISEDGPRIGDMVDRRRMTNKPPTVDEPYNGMYPITQNMVGKHPDAVEPKWKEMEQIGTVELCNAMRDDKVLTFQVWDPAERNENWPPAYFRKEPRPRRYVVTFADGSTKWVDTVTPEMDRALRVFAHNQGVWNTFHMKPKPAITSSWKYLAQAGGGFAFLVGSIYLGIRRKHSIPTDAIQAIEFAQSKADARKDAQVDVTLEDVGGLENIVEDLNEVIAFLKDPEQFKRLGAKPPKGLLMEGGPGVGKTLIAKAIAGEASVPFYSMSGAEFVEIIVGVGAARIRDLFKRARLNAPCLIFVDEIDALGTKRASAGTRGTEEHEQTLNQLLTEMDGFTPDTGVVFIGATNRADLLDPALMRPGRFDRKVTVPQPGLEARAKILQIHLAKRNVDPEIDTMQFAKNLPGLSGAELANICNEAAAISVRRGGDRIESIDVVDAVDRVTNGLRHPVLDKENETMYRVTRHELGHAIVATVLYQNTGLIEPVERVSIIPRGHDPTSTTYNRKRDEDYMFPTRARLLERVQVLLAGRAAEEVFFGEDITTMGSVDVRDANDLVRNMVVNYNLGQPDLVTTYTYDPDTLFTPEKTIQSRKARVASTGEMNRHEYNRKINGFGRKADFDHYQYAERKMLQIMNEAMENNKAIIDAHRAAFDVAYDELLSNDVLSGERLVEILAAHPPSHTDYPKTGPDTPCKPLLTEAEEEEQRVRVIADPREKMKYAVENYYTNVELDPPNLRDRENGLPNGRPRSEATLADYMPAIKQPQENRFREIPKEPWSIIALKENLAEDPEWLRREFIRFTREADEARVAELTSTLIPVLEGKMAEAGAGGGSIDVSKESTRIGRGRSFARGTLDGQAVGADGLTGKERRLLSLYRAELTGLQARWVNGEYVHVPEDTELPPMWRKDLKLSDEQIFANIKYGRENGELVYDLFEGIRKDFEAEGYVRCWNGKYYLESECVKTPRGTWSRREDLEKEEKDWKSRSGGKYKWLLDMECHGA